MTAEGVLIECDALRTLTTAALVMCRIDDEARGNGEATLSRAKRHALDYACRVAQRALGGESE